MHLSISYSDDEGSTSTTTWAGVNSMNIAVFNGLASDDIDAMQTEAKTMDKCMTHAAPNSNAIHAHSISPCGCQDESCDMTAKPGACNDSGVDCTVSSFWYANWEN